MPRRGAKVTVKFVTQNLRGLKTETRLEELFAYVQRSGVFAACVQETWRPDSEQLQNGPCLLLCTGLKSCYALVSNQSSSETNEDLKVLESRLYFFH